MPWASRYLWYASVRLTVLYNSQVSSPSLHRVRNVIWALLFGLPVWLVISSISTISWSIFSTCRGSTINWSYSKGHRFVIWKSSSLLVTRFFTVKISLYLQKMFFRHETLEMHNFEKKICLCVFQLLNSVTLKVIDMGFDMVMGEWV